MQHHTLVIPTDTWADCCEALQIEMLRAQQACRLLWRTDSNCELAVFHFGFADDEAGAWQADPCDFPTCNMVLWNLDIAHDEGCSLLGADGIDQRHALRAALSAFRIGDLTTPAGRRQLAAQIPKRRLGFKTTSAFGSGKVVRLRLETRRPI